MELRVLRCFLQIICQFIDYSIRAILCGQGVRDDMADAVAKTSLIPYNVADLTAGFTGTGRQKENQNAGD